MNNTDEYQDIGDIFNEEFDFSEEKLTDKEKNLIINNIVSKYPEVATLDILQKLSDEE